MLLYVRRGSGIMSTVHIVLLYGVGVGVGVWNNVKLMLSMTKTNAP